MESDGNKFYDKLRELSYPNMGKFHPTSFDWLFDVDEDASRFLHWFCESVNINNVVTSKELADFQSLLDSGITTLEGEHLDRAVSSLATKDDNLTDYELKLEIAKLENEREKLSDLKTELTRKRDEYSVHRLQFADQLGELETSLETCQTKKQKMESELSLLESMMIDTVETIRTTAEQITDGVEKPNLLCDSALWSEFLQNEEQFSASLKEICTTSLASEREDETVTGERSTNQLYEKQNAQLAHLQTKLPVAEENRLSYEMKAAISKAMILELETVDNEIKNETFPSTKTQLSFSEADYEAKSSSLLKEYLNIRCTVEDLVSRSAIVHCSPVLLGDCDWKLSRQQTLMDKQQNLARLLAKQWAREQLALLGLQIENEQLASFTLSFTDVTKQLDDYAKLTEKQKLAVQEAAEKEKLFNGRQTISSSDIFSRCLYSVISSLNDKLTPSLVSYAELPKAAQDFQAKYQQTIQSVQQMETKDQIQLKNMERAVRLLETIAFGGELTSSAQNLSQLESVEAAVKKLESTREDIQNQLKPIIKDFQAKHAAVKSDTLSAVERSLWTLFYNDPLTLRRKVETLKAKANILK